MPKSDICAWAAGIIDGEGYVTKGKDKRRNTTQPIVRVDNTDIRILQKLVDNFGGTILFAKRRNRPNSKPCWYWRLYNRKCIAFLREIEPYLVSRKEKAQEIISGNR